MGTEDSWSKESLNNAMVCYIFQYHSNDCGNVDIDECSEGSFSCPMNSQCINFPGSYSCQCNGGFVRNASECAGELFVSTCL